MKNTHTEKKADAGQNSAAGEPLTYTSEGGSVFTFTRRDGETIYATMTGPDGKAVYDGEACPLDSRGGAYKYFADATAPEQPTPNDIPGGPIEEDEITGHLRDCRAQIHSDGACYCNARRVLLAAGWQESAPRVKLSSGRQMIHTRQSNGSILLTPSFGSYAMTQEEWKEYCELTAAQKTSDTTKADAPRPNYRLYDQTGGGGTEDIYAESLEEAIEAGRKWIEDGDWSSEGYDGERVYRTIELECAVREIVYDEDGEIDEQATIDGYPYNCSGSYSDDLPDCKAPSEAPGGDDDSGGHEWKSPYSLVGGCKENPGVWSTGGTSFRTVTVCSRCGCYRDENDAGSQRNPGEPLCTVTIRERDEESEAWLKRKHSEDGWLPAWLAEMLGCSPTLKMTEEEAREYVESHTDDDEHDADDLEHAFAAIFDRRADDEERAEGLWSHLCAVVTR